MKLKLNKLLNLLKRKKIEPVAVFKASERIDTMVYITESIYIQLGKNYVFVINDKPNKFSMHETNGSTRDIISKLKKAISE